VTFNQRFFLKKLNLILYRKVFLSIRKIKPSADRGALKLFHLPSALNVLLVRKEIGLLLKPYGAFRDTLDTFEQFCPTIRISFLPKKKEKNFLC